MVNTSLMDMFLEENLEGTCCVVGGGGLLRPFLLLAFAAMTTAAAMRVMVRTAPTRTTNMKDGHPSRVNSSGFELLSTTEKCKKKTFTDFPFHFGVYVSILWNKVNDV